MQIETHKIMRRLLSAVVLSVLTITATYAQRIYRSEFVTFDTRTDALAGNRANTLHYLKYTPQPIATADRTEIVGEQIIVPVAWGDYDV